VLTPFGFHLIRVDEHKGDTLALRHILVPIQASDSASTRVDREADSLSRMAAAGGQGAKLDTAAQKLGLKVNRIQVIENEPGVMNGKVVPSVSAWAFGGAKPGETSDLFDDENGYYLARLDSLRTGGDPKFDDVKDLVRERVAKEQAIDKIVPQAQQLASAAATSNLEAAAKAANQTVQQTPMIARSSAVPVLGQFNEAIGAMFALPVGAVSQPVKTAEGAFVLRVDKRIVADSTAWAAQKDAQKTARLQQLRQQRIQMYLQDIRKAAKVDDRRKQINAAARRQDVAT
jgi:peptidyl-prolyl cis-trans isomerase D